MTSDAFISLLQQGQVAPALERRPEVFNASSAEDRGRLVELLGSNATVVVCDAIDAQLRDLAVSNLARKDLPQATVDREIERLLEGRDRSEHGCWVFYPWRATLVHTLPPDQFTRLRLDRNRNKITVPEQKTLASKTIAVIGLSVGRSVLMNMVLEGVGGSFRLSDPDRLDLSNLNRLRGSVVDLGVNKALLAAREAFEVNPFLDLEVFPEGTSEANLDRLLEGVDVVVEECDDLFMKVRVRERARALGIPVVMETSDLGMLDIERFDLEPSRPIFHGMFTEVDADALKGTTNKERIPFALRVLDDTRLSTRMGASLAEIEETVYTWPQLASAVSLGGAVVCDAVRRILLGSLACSGRFYVDLDRLVCASSTAEPPPAQPVTPGIAPEARLARALPPVPERLGAQLSQAELDFIVSHAVLAPSGGNSQPWRFEFQSNSLLCLRNPERAKTFLDYDGRGYHMAIGAAVENACLAALRLGLHPTVQEESGGRELVAKIVLDRRNAQEHPLRQFVGTRVTVRHLVPTSMSSETALRSLQEKAQALDLRLYLVQDEQQRLRIGDILGDVDRLRMFIEPYHDELFRELRWNPDEVLSTRTGIDIRSLEISPADMAGIRLMRRQDVVKFLRDRAMGGALRATARNAFRECSAVALISVPTSLSHFQFGRALERLWLQATSLDLGFQPWAAIFGMLPRAQASEGLEPEEGQHIRTVAKRLFDFWPVDDGYRREFIVRIVAPPPAPSSRSLRLNLREVFPMAR